MFYDHYDKIMMKLTLFVFLVGLLDFASSQDVYTVEEMEQSDCSALPENPDDVYAGGQRRSDVRDVQKGIVWRNCNRTRVDVQLISLSVAPYPFPLNKLLHLLNFSFEVTQSFGQPDALVEVDLSFKMLIDGDWRDLCELIGEEKCHKSDLCAELNYLFGDIGCPPDFQKQGFNCSCPIPEKVYNLTDLPVEKIVVPFRISGTFMGTVVFRKQGRDIACVEGQFCIVRC